MVLGEVPPRNAGRKKKEEKEKQGLAPLSCDSLQKRREEEEAEDEDENSSEKPKDRVYCPIYGQKSAISGREI